MSPKRQQSLRTAVAHIYKHTAVRHFMGPTGSLALPVPLSRLSYYHYHPMHNWVMQLVSFLQPFLPNFLFPVILASSTAAVSACITANTMHKFQELSSCPKTSQQFTQYKCSHENCSDPVHPISVLTTHLRSAHPSHFFLSGIATNIPHYMPCPSHPFP